MRILLLVLFWGQGSCTKIVPEATLAPHRFEANSSNQRTNEPLKALTRISQNEVDIDDRLVDDVKLVMLAKLYEGLDQFNKADEYFLKAFEIASDDYRDEVIFHWRLAIQKRKPVWQPIATHSYMKRLLGDRADIFAKDFNKAMPKDESKCLKNNASNIQNSAESTFNEGLYLACSGDIRRAKELLAQASVMFEAQKEPSKALSSLEELIYLLRKNDFRQEAASYYGELVSFWERYPQASTVTRRIDHMLWAARYQALIGKYDLAKKFGQGAIDLALRNLDQGASKKKYELSELVAEGYFVLATRVAVDEKNFKDALSLLQKAAKTRFLTNSWRNRLAWYEGLTHFLIGSHDKAVLVWKRLQKNGNAKQMQSRLLFWLAKAYGEMGKLAQRDSCLKNLAQNDPFDYYAIVASFQNPSLELSSWKTWLKGRPLEDRFSDLSQFKNQKLMQNSRLARLIKRVEILVGSGLGEMAKKEALLVYEAAKANLRNKEWTQDLIYVSRVLYAVGSYKEAIQLTLNLSYLSDFWQTWPEQIYIFFPKPFGEIYGRYANSNFVDQNALYAITRQESLFNLTAKSPANAYGLMQLIRPTAERVAKEMGTPLEATDKLFDPGVNVGLAALYIRELEVRYQGNRQAVFAAYNAGEFVVDKWLLTRPNLDPLMWIELIPFGETQEYVKKVLRNEYVYKMLKTRQNGISLQESFAKRSLALAKADSNEFAVSPFIPASRF